MLRRASLVLLMIFGYSRLAIADASCPQSCTTNGITRVCSAAAQRDSSTSESCDPYPGYITSRATYDLVRGTVNARSTTCDFAGNGWASVEARDRFRLVGPPDGGLIQFQARLAVSGAAGLPGTVAASLSEEGGQSSSANDQGYGGFSQTLVIVLNHSVGEEFEIFYEANASAASTAVAQGALSFALPDGYGVTSCQGFQGEGAVPVRRATWGTLKARYR